MNAPLFSYTFKIGWTPTRPPPTPIRGRIISQIISETAERHGYSVKELTGPARYASLCRARFEAMWLAYHVRRPDGSRLYSLPQIGRAFGRDHTTVINALRRHAAFLAAEKVAA